MSNSDKTQSAGDPETSDDPPLSSLQRGNIASICSPKTTDHLVIEVPLTIDSVGEEPSDGLVGALSPEGSEDLLPNRQDYRLDFTEVEGNLEAVPEEGTATHLATTVTLTTAGAPMTNTPQCAGSTEARPPIGADVPWATFHIPESNASETGAFSEYSFPANGDTANKSSYMAGFMRNSQPLSAKQQVALWLTRSSMSDMSSMPSLRSLVFPSSSRSGNQGKREERTSNQRKAARSDQSRACRGKGDVHRNYSTKSLINGYGDEQPKDSDMMTPTTMRKCETVMAISSGGLSTRPSSASVVSQAGVASTECSSRRSSLSLFRKLTGRSRESQRGAHSTSTQAQGYQRDAGMHPSSSTTGMRTPKGPHHSFSVASDVFGDSSFNTTFPGIQPMNRLRSTSSVMCSRCASSMMSVSRITSRCPSQNSLMPSSVRRTSRTSMVTTVNDEPEMTCKICLVDVPMRETFKLQNCGCSFCKECLNQYVCFEIMEGAYDISCPDSECDKQGVIQLTEMEPMIGTEMLEKYQKFRLNTEVALDSNRTWCPAANCNTICHVCEDPAKDNDGSAGPVECPSCSKEFCSKCSGNWHAGKTCKQYGEELYKRSLHRGVSQGGEIDAMIFDRFNGDIKPCPMCRVPIERDAGCAQMMCKRCKHVFCWFCQTSLDDDFLLRHYDSGTCKGLLGHSRMSVLWHRAQVIGIFAGFGLLLLVASPVLLIAAPCILCCRCKIIDKLEADMAGASHLAAGGASSLSSDYATPEDSPIKTKRLDSD
eukprot:maker-scaffold1516_size37830-snap-gene-0.8 protein:Tk12636 transcript:maker-scaffold1516_size37830-snap-gene-0.8-mRNA-1 annotation:"probable e3 ubiquitin-protein ligase rnf144a isoform x2"